MENCPSGWSEQRIGEETFWSKNQGPSQILIGVGPPLGPGTSISRLQRLAAEPEFPFSKLVCTRQIHGSSILVVGEDPIGSDASHDGLISTMPSVGLAVWTADCVPVLISGGGAVSAVHAGWRGTAAGIVPQALRLFNSNFGVNPTDISATIGPAIGACHYPVGSEVTTALDAWSLADCSWHQAGSVDLRLFLLGQLVDLGISESAVEIVGPCTSCDSRFASFRRDADRAGRQISIVGLVAS